jgi:type IV pilus assembly protein PilP
VALAGCAADYEELQVWIDQQRQQVKPRVQPLVPPSRFEPEAYAGARSVDPFSPQKLSVALKLEVRQVNSLLAGELNRRKEALESFPLDGMVMVGSLSRKGQPLALLKVDGLLHQVKVGDYVGQNYGRVTKIDETQIALREIVQDPTGEWIERAVTLQLQEGGR